MKKIVFYNVIIFVFFYSLLEVFTGYIFFKNKLDCSYLLCNRTYNFVTPFDFYGKNNKTIYSRDKYGFRGRYKNLDKIDILVVGGSTTDERFLKLEDTWTENLEKIFLNKNKKIDVVNAGLDGQSTYGHIWNFENWFNKLKNHLSNLLQLHHEVLKEPHLRFRRRFLFQGFLVNYHPNHQQPLSHRKKELILFVQ